MNYAVAVMGQWQPRKEPVMKNSKATDYASMCQQIAINTLVLSLLKVTHMSSVFRREIPKKCSRWL